MRKLTLIVATVFGLAMSGAAFAGGGHSGCAYGKKKQAAGTQSPVPQVTAPVTGTDKTT